MRRKNSFWEEFKKAHYISLVGGFLISFLIASFFLLSNRFSLAAFDGFVGLRFFGLIRLPATKSSILLKAICLFSSWDRVLPDFTER